MSYPYFTLALTLFDTMVVSDKTYTTIEKINALYRRGFIDFAIVVERVQNFMFKNYLEHNDLLYVISFIRKFM